MPGAVVVVQADSAILEVLTVALKASGCRVQGFATGEEALKCLRSNSFNVDLLVTDYYLPERISGQELAAEVRRMNPSIPVLIVSREDWNGDRQAGFEAHLKLRFFPASTYFVPLLDKSHFENASLTGTILRLYHSLKCLDPGVVVVWAAIMLFLLLLWGVAIAWLI